MLLLVAQVSHAKDLGAPWENSLPHINTEQELRRYEKTRKITFWTSVGLGVTTIGLVAYSQHLSNKARAIDVYGPLTAFPQPNGSTLIYRPVIPESQERQANLRRDSKNVARAAIVTGLASAVLGALTISITF
jgi:hypothetical protein